MLSKNAFDYGLDLLNQNYDRQLTDDIKEIWRSHLDENLNDEEFLGAVRHAIIHSRFMPTVGSLVDQIRGDKEVKALQEWGMIVDAVAKGNVEERLAYLSDRARIALKGIGGVEAIGWANSVDRQRLEKKFVSIYCQCSSEDRKALAQSAHQTSDQTPRDTMHDTEEMERNRLERQRRWEQQRSNQTNSTPDL